MERDQKQTLLELLRRLWCHITPRRRMQIGILLVLMILASLAEVISIGAILPFLGVLTAPQRVFQYSWVQPLILAFNITKPNQLLLPLTIIFACAAFFSGFIHLVLLWVQTRLSFAIGSDLSNSIYYRTLYQPYAVHVARNSSEVISGISGKAKAITNNTIVPILTIFSSILMSTAIMSALVVVEPFISFAAFLGFGLIYLVVIFFTKAKLTYSGKQISLRQSQVIKTLQEGLGGIRDVLLNGAQLTYYNVYRNVDHKMRTAQAKIYFIGTSPRYGIESLSMILISFLAYFLAGRPEGLATVIPVIGALALGAQRLLPALQQTFNSWALLRGGQASLSDTIALLDQPLPQFAGETMPTPISFQYSITLKNLAFRYTPEAPWVLQGLNLSIIKGSKVGFIGPTGSGKSTLLDIIMGLLQTPKGNLEIDGVVISNQNQRSWQAHIAHVPQMIFLSDCSIAENIAFGVPPDQIDYERVRKVSEKAQISHTIESWGKQYATVVGERGIRLSGGQRQRIGIARALYKKADVIVFDEATSALDNETERDVINAIQSLDDDLTILIVAHRLTTLQYCNQVIELTNGRIKRVGTYAEMISD